MKKILFLILILAQIQARGQTNIERHSINAQSGTSPVFNFYVSWSIGEPIVGTVQAGNFILTQGFQQPDKGSPLSQTNICVSYNADNTNQRCNPQTWQPFALQLGSELLKAENVTFQKKTDGSAIIKGNFRDVSWKVVSVNLNLSGYTTTGTATRVGCLTANSSTTGWYYYSQWSGTIQKVNQPILNITGASAMQIGTGANTEDISELGAFGKFSTNTGQVGQIAVKLINPVPCTNAIQTAESFIPKGVAELNRIQLSWTENLAQAGEYFIVEKQHNGNFEKLEAVKLLNQTGTRYYVTYDNLPDEGDNIYRIVLMQNDGSRRESELILVPFSKTVNAVVFPNPSDSYFDVLMNEARNQETKLTLVNIFGQIMQEEKSQNLQKFHLDVSNLPSGMYLIRISQTGKRDFTKEVVKN